MTFAARRLMPLALALLAASFAGACASQEITSEPITAQRGPAPAYDEVAREFNANAQRLARFRAQASIRVSFIENDQRRTEEVDGLLQVIRPDRLALSFRKVSQTLFWLGCDPQRYWWIDLSGGERFAAIGQHELFGPVQARAMGLAIQPLDLVRLLGVVPLPIDPRKPAGVTQWSADGTLVGVSTPLADGGRQRLWLDASTKRPMLVELYDAEGKPVLVSSLRDHDFVKLSNSGETGPLLATKVHVNQVQFNSELILFLSGLQDGLPNSDRPIADSAFDFAKLQSTFQVARVIDLDAPASPPVPSASPAPTGNDRRQ